MRVFICGQKAFGEAVYRLCKHRGDDVAGVSAPIFGGDGRSADRLRRAALGDGVRVYLAGGLRASVLPEGVDVIIAAHSYDFISAPVRNKSKLGAVGYHPSLLPLHRGRDAVEWAIRMRDRVTGGSVYWLDNGVDTGDIAAQEHVFIHPRDDAQSLWREKLFPLGVVLFSRVLADLDAGVIRRTPQDKKIATWEPSIKRSPLFRPELPQLGAPPVGYRVEAGGNDYLGALERVVGAVEV